MSIIDDMKAYIDAHGIDFFPSFVIRCQADLSTGWWEALKDDDVSRGIHQYIEQQREQYATKK